MRVCGRVCDVVSYRRFGVTWMENEIEMGFSGEERLGGRYWMDQRVESRWSMKLKLELGGQWGLPSRVG